MIKEINDYNELVNLSEYTISKENPFAKQYGLYINNIIIGYIECAFIYDKAELNYLFIVENYRKKGNGSKLLDHFIKECHNRNINDITLEVNCTNETAIKLYQKYNFKIVAKREKYYNNTDGLLMRRVD